jgi:hypothetical protein
MEEEMKTNKILSFLLAMMFVVFPLRQCSQPAHAEAETVPTTTVSGTLTDLTLNIDQTDVNPTITVWALGVKQTVQPVWVNGQYKVDTRGWGIWESAKIELNGQTLVIESADIKAINDSGWFGPVNPIKPLTHVSGKANAMVIRTEYSSGTEKSLDWALGLQHEMNQNWTLVTPGIYETTIDTTTWGQWESAKILYPVEQQLIVDPESDFEAIPGGTKDWFRIKTVVPVKYFVYLPSVVR